MKYLALILLALLFSCSSEPEVKSQKRETQEEPSDYEKNLEFAKKSEAWDANKKEIDRQRKEQGKMGFTATKPLIQVNPKDFNRIVVNAKKGNPEAQYKLAMCYKYGLGIKQSTKYALFWFKKSSDQGHLQARRTYLFMLKRK